MIRRWLRSWRQRWRQWRQPSRITAITAAGGAAMPAPLATLVAEIGRDCSECGACSQDCAFLHEYGGPRAMAIGLDFTSPLQQRIAYQCSLCGLCTARCPQGLDPARMFLDIRRFHIAAGQALTQTHRPLIRYQALGQSALFSAQALPPGCETIFFPGCALPGTRPALTWQLYQQLRRTIPTLGLVLNCCAKPGHDLGQTAAFHRHFDQMRDQLTRQGIRTVLTACPNCTKIFRQYGQGIGQGLRVTTVYELFHAQGLARGQAATARGEVSVHDPCPFRDDPAVQGAVRGLLTDLGYTVTAMPHQGQQTLCCGQGGGAALVRPDLGQGWAQLRRREAADRTLVTYCAGCTEFLHRVTPTIHILDLLLPSAPAAAPIPTLSRAPFTYLNRLRLRHSLKKRA